MQMRRVLESIHAAFLFHDRADSVSNARKPPHPLPAVRCVRVGVQRWLTDTFEAPGCRDVLRLDPMKYVVSH